MQVGLAMVGPIFFSSLIMLGHSGLVRLMVLTCSCLVGWYVSGLVDW